MIAALLAALAAWLAIPARVRPSRPVGAGRPAVRGIRHDRVGALTALAAELRAGAPPQRALLAGGRTWPRARDAASRGADIAMALEEDGDASLAACWRVAERSGAGLARSVERLAAAERDADEVRGQLRAQLAAPRSSARVLATLPLIGIAMGAALGAEPIAWLAGTPAGRACALLAIALTVAGLAWIARIAASVERML